QKTISEKISLVMLLRKVSRCFLITLMRKTKSYSKKITQKKLLLRQLNHSRRILFNSNKANVSLDRRGSGGDCKSPVSKGTRVVRLYHGTPTKSVLALMCDDTLQSWLLGQYSLGV